MIHAYASLYVLFNKFLLTIMQLYMYTYAT